GSGTASLPASYINLANGTQVDVTYPPNNSFTPEDLANLNTSLWSISLLTVNGAAVNGSTINMQVIDTSFNSTGTYYYAMRAQVDEQNIYFGNLKMSAINLGHI
ncbi:MAG: hypothetical protein MUP82_07285, partial [Candidatus Marinimicrobia bacterium]|nr:hypothetical protein [Candidatus Neomarinimicrobiota bacterium]